MLCFSSVNSKRKETHLPALTALGSFKDLQLSSHLVRTLESPSQFTHVCAGLSPLLNVESNRSWCWQSLLSTLGGGTAASVPTNVTIVFGGVQQIGLFFSVPWPN